MSSWSKTTSKSFVTKGDLMQQPLCWNRIIPSGSVLLTVVDCILCNCPLWGRICWPMCQKYLGQSILKGVSKKEIFHGGGWRGQAPFPSILILICKETFYLNQQENNFKRRRKFPFFKPLPIREPKNTEVRRITVNEKRRPGVIWKENPLYNVQAGPGNELFKEKFSLTSQKFYNIVFNCVKIHLQIWLFFLICWSS